MLRPTLSRKVTESPTSGDTTPRCAKCQHRGHCTPEAALEKGLIEFIAPCPYQPEATLHDYMVAASPTPAPVTRRRKPPKQRPAIALPVSALKKLGSGFPWHPRPDYAEYFRGLRAPSRNYPGNYYNAALTDKFARWLIAREPELYLQLLFSSGVERYFVPCVRLVPFEETT